MQQTIYQVDAFSNQLFAGNPAAVCPLDKWLDDGLMQKIAAENNLAETAFFVRSDDIYELRWFTPESEVDLCGHATLASAYVIFRFLDPAVESVSFMSRSGPLQVEKKGEVLSMDFPAQPPALCQIPDALQRALPDAPQICLKREDYILVYPNEASLRQADPDLRELMALDLRGVIITAPGDNCDFVARFFAPKYGIPEDPVTGSAYTQLVPYWSEKMARNCFTAKQLSRRGGQLNCKLEGERVKISGQAVLYMQGTIELC